MSIRRKTIKGREYEIDLEALSFGLASELIHYGEKQDIERLTRTMNAIVIKAIGVGSFVSIPSGDYPVVAQEIVTMLQEGNPYFDQ